MSDMAYVNSEWAPLAEARVPINDRAYYFADAVYEVCATFGGKVFLLGYHLDRLERSLRGVRIGYSVDRRWLAALIEEGIEKAGYAETVIYMQISRGVALREKRFPAECAPTLMMTFREKPQIAAEKRARGIKTLLVPDDRWAHCDYKTIMLLPNLLAHQRALDAGKDDAVFYDGEKGIVHEATSANVFIVRAGRVAAPEEGPKALPGTVRRHVIDLARRNGIVIEERPMTVAELLAADEVFLTGTTIEVLPVVQVDDRVIGDGMPGPMTRKLHTMFRESLNAG